MKGMVESMSVEIIGANIGSVAEKLNIEKHSKLISINKKPINDILDYGFYSTEKKLLLEIERPNGNVEEFNVSKKEFEDVGFLFETFLMDKQHSCRNKCLFCFIDQLPKGMREPLYFKDDDERLSYLFGNYITLTNIEDKDIDRIIEMKITPINISVHTTDSELRNFVMGNRFAGEKLRYIKKLADGGIRINCQIVLCKGINDKQHLEKTVEDLINLYPSVESIAVVPSGLTDHRSGLHKLECFNKSDAISLLETIERYAKDNYKKYGTSIVYPADEWFLLSEKEIPETAFYDDFSQIENGVGMLSTLREEFLFSLEDKLEEEFCLEKQSTVDIITGEASADFIKMLVDKAKEHFSELSVRVHKVKNKFFGGNVSVSGLLTGKDIVESLGKQDIIGDVILLPKNILRSEMDLLLDDMTPEQLEEHFGKPIVFIESGEQLLDAVIGKTN